MYCKNCGVDIGEDVNFCPKCGFRQKKLPSPEKIEDKLDIEDKSKKSNFLNTTSILIISIALLTIIYLLTPETMSVPYQESYEEPVYRIEYYQEPVYIMQSYTYSCGFLNLKTCSDQRQVLDHYEQKSKQVFDHNEIKYRTKYKDVTKKRYEWFIERINSWT